MSYVDRPNILAEELELERQKVLTLRRCMAKLREEIEATPHDKMCATVMYKVTVGAFLIRLGEMRSEDWPVPPCDCWKSRALALIDGAEKCGTEPCPHCTDGIQVAVGPDNSIATMPYPLCQLEKCETCGGSGKVSDDRIHSSRKEMPCPDCQTKPKEERLWRVRITKHNGIQYLRALPMSAEETASFITQQIIGTKQFSEDGGKTWEDSDG